MTRAKRSAEARITNLGRRTLDFRFQSCDLLVHGVLTVVKVTIIKRSSARIDDQQVSRNDELIVTSNKSLRQD